MNVRDCIVNHVDELINSDAEAKNAIQTFFANIPGRILQVDIDTKASNKQGVVMGDSVYKFGIVVENSMAFLEFYENRNQGEPSMSLYADKSKKIVTVRGMKVDKKFFLCYKTVNGKVEKACKME